MPKKTEQKVKIYSGIKVKQLPSGSWHAKVFAGTTDQGKDLYEPFTDPDPDEVGRQILEFKSNKKRKKSGRLTVEEAVDEYINSRDGILSPATIRAYKEYKKNHLGSLGKALVSDVDTNLLQDKANDLAKTPQQRNKTEKLGPKYIENLMYFFITAIRYAGNKSKFELTLSEVIEKDIYVPTDEDIIRLVEGSLGTKLGKAILIALCNLDRRSQVAALEYGDLDALRGRIKSKRAIVMNDENIWVTKDRPKSSAGIRETEVPDIIFQLLGTGEPTEKVVGLVPNSITMQFGRLLKRLGLPHFRFHDLRHYGASVMLALGVPDKYAQKRGGWKTGTTLKKIYQHTLDKKQNEVDGKINAHIEGIIERAIDTENRNETRNNA